MGSLHADPGCGSLCIMCNKVHQKCNSRRGRGCGCPYIYMWDILGQSGTFRSWGRLLRTAADPALLREGTPHLYLPPGSAGGRGRAPYIYVGHCGTFWDISMGFVCRRAQKTPLYILCVAKCRKVCHFVSVALGWRRVVRVKSVSFRWVRGCQGQYSTNVRGVNPSALRQAQAGPSSGEPCRRAPHIAPYEASI